VPLQITQPVFHWKAKLIVHCCIIKVLEELQNPDLGLFGVMQAAGPIDDNVIGRLV